MAPDPPSVSHPTETALSLALLETLFTITSLRIAFLDTDLRYLRISASLAADNGLPVAAHLGRTGRDVFGELASLTEPALRQVLATGVALVGQEISAPIPTTPEEQGYWLMNYYPVQAANGVLLGVAVVVEDITARVRAEQVAQRTRDELECRVQERTAELAAVNAALRAEMAERQRVEALYRLIAEHSHDLIRVLDQESRFVYVSPSHRTVLGYDPAELLGRSIFDVIHPDDQTMMQARWGPLIARGAGQVEYRHRHADGSWRWVEVLATRIDEQGQRLVVGVVRDITARKRLEAQLLQAQKMESIGRFVGGIAHDFNNLLTVIGGYQDLVLTALSDQDPLREDLEQAQHATQRAARLIEQLLAFARKQVIDPQIINLNGLILSVDQLLRRLLGTHIELITLPTSDALFVRVDPHQIEQVLINLIVNARDAMPTGGTLTIATEAVDTPIPQEQPDSRGSVELVRLLVRDSGSGMTEEVQAHIFEPFFTTKPKGQGTGLGLATCYGIITQHGGTIEVDSAPGQGTAVRISLPRVGAPTSMPAPSPARSELLHGTETILLVEDEGAVRSFARRTLEAQGYTVLEAANGLEALRIAQEYGLERIDLVLTDVVMPQLGGIALVEQLRALRPDVKVLFMSGYAEDDASLFGQMRQGAAFLPKPFTPAVLAQRVWDVLERV
jgi:two-component system, cell cycle sensor histidine kinase and response regulator CckA